MKTLNTIYLWLMLAACVLALAGCVEEKVSGTGEGGNISVKMNVNARGGSDGAVDICDRGAGDRAKEAGAHDGDVGRAAGVMARASS